MIGNTLGAVINWSIGRWLVHYADRPWFPASPKRVEQASRWFRRYGTWSLLFSWVPIVGDPLTVIAGSSRVPLDPDSNRKAGAVSRAFRRLANHICVRPS
jgi:membrane protein YqaA with SNARE-associated domain